MESVTILRDLWRLRVWVCLVASVAIATGCMFAYRVSVPLERRSYSVGVATANVLVDTPKSQVVDIAPKGSDTLGARANVLANLMVEGEIKNAIARRAGLPPNQLIASAQSGGATNHPLPLNARSHAFTTSVALTSDMAELPIIRLQTQAPDVGQAINLANAAVAGLGEYLDLRANSETVSDKRRLRMRALGTAQGQVATRGPSGMTALAVAIVVFLAGCAMILAASAFVRGWRAAEQDIVDSQATPEELSEDDMLEQDESSVRRRRNEATKLRAY